MDRIINNIIVKQVFYRCLSARRQSNKKEERWMDLLPSITAYWIVSVPRSDDMVGICSVSQSVTVVVNDAREFASCSFSLCVVRVLVNA